MLAVLVADDPRRSADRILGRLVQIHRARGGAILLQRGRQAEVWLSAGLSLAALVEMPVRWTDHERSLAAGRSVVEPGFALLPAMLGNEMVAAIYLAQPEGAAFDDTRVFGTAVAQAVRARSVCSELATLRIRSESSARSSTEPIASAAFALWRAP